MKEIVEAVAAVGRLVPHQQALAALTEALAGRERADPVAVGALRVAAARTPVVQAAVERLCDAWRGTPGIRGAMVAGMLAAAHRAAAVERETIRVEPVVTGPQSRHVPLRATRQAFESVAVAALEELLVLTYSAHTDSRIRTALTAAAERGVRVRVLLETTRADGGTLHAPALDALAGLPAQFFVWDPNRRPRQGARASMHAKGIVADRHSAFVTSANLSGNAFDTNIEVGVRIVGGDLPARLRDHFDALVANAVLVPVTPGQN
ncbi:DISARM system phospholipase D-like protein DrmC [Micromonospora tulbaghiae]|uniref:PLD-like domain-containing protein n=1 Tax=Micromonospora tulbaghiae TaxID=479978 RepID=A0ABY0KNW5_9ACTN|nr:DISARM system phospholipase D-like protein DrmC [Micromonospora tulbaghiae]MDX5457484.1 DISARM system phospholipase D-like protein DrmC [Micromonospora tulbaghiae]SCE95024.1 PLD-like domain-containing protein [Micromonospora tulbaghiae]